MTIGSEAREDAGRAHVGAAAAAIFFGICAATYVVNAADRVIFPVLLRPLTAEYGFNLPQGGFLATIYLLGLGLGGIGTGYLLDRWSRKGTMIAGIVVYSIFTILTAAALGFADMATYRIMTGIGEAMQNVALVIAVGAFYAGSRTFVIGLIQCALGLGSFLGPRIGAALMASTGDWRIPFYAFGVAGLVGAVAVAFVARGFTERRQAAPGARSIDDDTHIPEGLWNRNVVCITLAVLFRSFPFFAFVALYTTYLTTQLNFSLGAAAGALSLFGLGPFFSPFAGYIADRTNQKLFQIAMLAIMAVAGFLIFNAAKTPLEQNLLALIEGTAGGFAYVNGYSFAQRSVKASLVARASGFYYAAATLPAAISGYLMAKLVDVLGWSLGSTLFMSVLLIVPVGISLFIDTTRVTGHGRRLAPGRRFWT